MKTWMIEDASQLAVDNPTTFFTPSPEVIKSLSPGNIVKLIFNPVDPEELCGERMWVDIESADAGNFTGYLYSMPNIKGLKYGDLIEFEDKNIIDIYTGCLDRLDPYFKRCLVSNRVLNDGEMPHYISWTPPESTTESGWLILSGDEDEDYMNEDSNLNYIPLGMIVHHDDSFKHLLFLEKDTRYYWNEEQLWEGIYEH